MDASDLRALEAPLKDKYKDTPDAAHVTLKAKGQIDDVCKNRF